MHAPRISDVLAALLMGLVTWSVWPVWSAQVAPAIPPLPGAWMLLASLLAFRLALAPVRATFSLLLRPLGEDARRQHSSD